MGAGAANDDANADGAEASRDGATARVSSRPSSRPKGDDTPMHGLTGMDHPSMKLTLSLPEGWESRAAVAAVAGARASAFADGELRVGTHFNARMWDPVSQAKFFDDRPWSAVDAFARGVVQGTVNLATLSRDDADADDDDDARRTPSPAALAPAGVCPGPGVNLNGARLDPDPSRKPGKRPKHTFRVPLSYYGPAFAGWAWSSNDKPYTDGDAPWAFGEYSVSAAVQMAFAPAFEGDKSRPIQTAGRTDKGVHGAAQCVSFWSFNDVEDLDAFSRWIAASPAGRAGVLRVPASESGCRPGPGAARVNAAFHATFCATWRRYVYVLPMRQLMREDRTPSATVDAEKVNELLAALTRESSVDCWAFARDTPPGKDSRCAFKVARAFESTVPRVDGDEADAGRRRNARNGGDAARDGSGSRARAEEASEASEAGRDDSTERVLVIELVADRFLRKLVRVLVATAVREAAAGAAPDVLLALSAAGERTATAPPAPPNGLMLAGVGYGDHPEWDRRDARSE